MWLNVVMHVVVTKRENLFRLHREYGNVVLNVPTRIEFVSLIAKTGGDDFDFSYSF